MFCWLARFQWDRDSGTLSDTTSHNIVVRLLPRHSKCFPSGMDCLKEQLRGILQRLATVQEYFRARRSS